MRMTPLGVPGLTALAALTAALVVGVCGCGGERSGSLASGAHAGQRGFALCSAHPDDCNSGERRPAGTMTIGMTGAVRGISPFVEDGADRPENRAVIGIIAPAAFVVLPGGSVRYNADLLTEEPRIVATNPQTVVYRIRPRARWSDGMPVSADDFEYNWRVRADRPRVAQPVPSVPPDPTAQGAGETGSARTVQAVDELPSGYELINAVSGSDNGKTVTVVFSSPDPDWKTLFAAIVPAHIAKAPELSTREALLASKDVFLPKPEWSGGPYVVSSFEPGRQIEFAQNTAWYGRERPTLEKLVFRFYDDRSSALAAMERGELDALDLEPDSETITRINALAQTGVDAQFAASHRWAHLDLNISNQYLAHRPLREAVFTGIGTGEIIEKAVRDVFPTARPRLAHHLFPGQVGYRDVVGETAPDQGAGQEATARKTLVDAGYTITDTGMLTPTGTTVPPLRLRYAGSDPVTVAAADLIRVQLRRIGVAVAVEQCDDLPKALASGDFDLALVEEDEEVSVADAVARWRGAVNPTRWQSADSDILLERAAVELDETKRAQILNRQDELMTAAAVVLPLYQRARMLALSGGYVNIRANAAGGVLTYNAMEWGVCAA